MPPKRGLSRETLRMVPVIAIVATFLVALPLASAGAPLPGSLSLGSHRFVPNLSFPWLTGKFAEKPLVASVLAKDPKVKVGPEVLASGSQEGAGTWEAVDPVTGYIYVVWQSGLGIGFSRSVNGGTLFLPPLVVPGSEDVLNNTSSEYTFSFNPTVTTSSNGTVYVAFAYSTLNLTTGATPPGEPYIAVSFNHGLSFAFDSVVARLSPTSFMDSPYVAAGPGSNVYMTWVYSPNGSTLVTACTPIGCGYSNGEFDDMFARSTDSGHTWSRMTSVAPGYPNSGGGNDPLVVGPAGRIGVLFVGYTVSGTNFSLSDGREYFTSSSDLGRTWSAPVEVGNPLFTTSDSESWLDGHLAVSSGGIYYAAYDSQAPGGDLGWLVYSTNGGRSWSTPVEVTTNTTAAHLMAVVAGPASVAYVGWAANDSSLGWSGWVAKFAVATHYLSPAVRVNSLYSLPGSYIGDTVAETYVGHSTVSMAWGITQNVSGNYTENVYNVVTQFP
jgi:hypothetical protein